MDDVAVLVAQHLNLDVARVDDELLEEDAVVAEGVQRLGLHGGETLGHVVVRMGDADALAPAPGRGLDHHRIADLARDLHRLVRRFDQAHVTRHGRDARLGGELLGGDLVAHGVDRLGVRPDEGDALGLQPPREPGVFRQEAEARVHGLRPRLLHGVHDLVLDQIGLGGGRRADVNRLVRHLACQRPRVGVGVDDYRLNAHATAGLDDANSDLAAVGDQNFIEHFWALQRDVVVLLPGIFLGLVLQRLQGLDQAATRAVGHDDVVDVA
ncbi:hypothetical protein D3C77_459520 [compost metagenome]